MWLHAGATLSKTHYNLDEDVRKDAQPKRNKELEQVTFHPKQPQLGRSSLKVSQK